MATPVSDLLILAIPIAMWLPRRFNNCKMINEAVKDSYWNCLFIYSSVAEISLISLCI